VGQWQAIRLGVVDGERVTVEERGVAPWFSGGESSGEDGDAQETNLETGEAEADDNN
jgi:hypothetical protein